MKKEKTKTKKLNPKKTIYVSFEHGNDFSGVIGKIYKPFKTVLYAEKLKKKHKGSVLYILNESEVKIRKKRKLSFLHKLKIFLSRKDFILTTETKMDHFIEDQENIIVHILKNGRIKEIKIQIIENEIEISDTKGKSHIIKFDTNKKFPFQILAASLRYF